MTSCLVEKALLASMVVRRHGVCTHLRTDRGPLLFTGTLNPSGVSAAVCSASSPSTDFLQDWDLDTGSIFSLSFVTLVTCFGSLTCCKTRPQPVFSVLAKGRSRSLSVMKPCCGLIASSPRPELFRCSLANLSQALQDFMSPWHGSTSADLWS